MKTKWLEVRAWKITEVLLLRDPGLALSHALTCSYFISNQDYKQLFLDYFSGIIKQNSHLLYVVGS
jgi:hypothetical protein